MMSETVATRARARVRAEMDRQNLTQTDIAGILKWSQSRVSKLLNGVTELAVDDLAALCFAVGIPVTEAVRDQGFEFCAEMTPTEMKILQTLRTRPAHIVQAITTMLFAFGSETKGAKFGKPRPR